MILVIILSSRISSFSQITSICVMNSDTMVLITPAQLKATNQIFNDHFNTKVELGLVKEQLESYKQMYADELEIDSTYEATVAQLTECISQYNFKLEKQQSQLNKVFKRVKCWKICSGGLFIIFIICML